MNNELPNGWEWQGGESGDNYYTYNFGTKYYQGGDLVGVHGLGGYHGQVFWDKGERHIVSIRLVIGFNGDDPVYGYDTILRDYGSEEKALEAVPEIIQEIKDSN
jgi:hypothetical protein